MDTHTLRLTPPYSSSISLSLPVYLLPGKIFLNLIFPLLCLDYYYWCIQCAVYIQTVYLFNIPQFQIEETKKKVKWKGNSANDKTRNKKCAWKTIRIWITFTHITLKLFCTVSPPMGFMTIKYENYYILCKIIIGKKREKIRKLKLKLFMFICADSKQFEREKSPLILK